MRSAIVKKIPLSDRTRKFLRRMARPAFWYFISRGTKPLSRYHGFDRGEPIDRFYIDRFIEENQGAIRGACLELLNDNYTIRYGKEKVTKSDILDIDKANANATVIGDLRRLSDIADGSYDCIILTQVLQFIDDIDAAISECHRILKTGGTLLATLPSLSRIDPTSGAEGDYWRFTAASARYAFGKRFEPGRIAVESKGNVRSGMYFLAGLSQEDAPRKALEADDADFPVIITVRAVK